MDGISYANIFDFVIYAMICSSPDIVYIVSIVNMFMSNTRPANRQAL